MFNSVQPEAPEPRAHLEKLFRVAGERLSGDLRRDEHGYPLVSASAFDAIQGELPHLYADGQALLEWSDEAGRRGEIPRGLVQFFRQIVFSSSICASAELWALGQVLVACSRCGILDDWRMLGTVDIAGYSREKGYSIRHLKMVADFLCAHHLLDLLPGPVYQVRNSSLEQIILFTTIFTGLPLGELEDPVARLVALCRTGRGSAFNPDGPDPVLGSFLNSLVAGGFAEAVSPLFSESFLRQGHLAFILLLAVSWLSSAEPEAGSPIGPEIAPLAEGLRMLGMCCADSRWTSLGVRCASRAGGPLGIVYSYRHYFHDLSRILRSGSCPRGVIRPENIVASRQSHVTTMIRANDALDDFCRIYRFPIKVFIEHAMGCAAAIEDRFQRSGGSGIQYFGADLELGVVEDAVGRQKAGLLPHNAIFLPSCDIGMPNVLLERVERSGFATKGSIMIVGNGFHEIDCGEDEMIALLRAYQDAGVILIMIEESLLDNGQLRASRFNTYHAVFRFLHEMSNQRLRSHRRKEKEPGYPSWHCCMLAAGYTVLDRFSFQSRRILPCHDGGEMNVPISSCYFCVPKQIFTQLQTASLSPPV